MEDGCVVPVQSGLYQMFDFERGLLVYARYAGARLQVKPIFFSVRLCKSTSFMTCCTIFKTSRQISHHYYVGTLESYSSRLIRSSLFQIPPTLLLAKTLCSFLPLFNQPICFPARISGACFHDGVLHLCGFLTACSSR